MGNTFTRCVRRKKVKHDSLPDSAPTRSELAFSPVSTSSPISTEAAFRYGSLSRSSIRRGISRQESQFRKNPAIGLQVTDSYAQNPWEISRGFAFIFEMTEFDSKVKEKYGLMERSEHAKDAKDLKDVLTEAGYEVCHYQNFTEANARSMLKLYTTGNKLSEVDSFICVILTASLRHRKTGERQYAFYDKLVPQRKLCNPIRKCTALSGVPKLFFFPAESLPDPSVSADSEGNGSETLTRHAVQGTIGDNPVEPDFLYVYSLSDRLCSSDYPELGSYFVQKLVSVLLYNSVHRKMDFLRILALLTRDLQDIGVKGRKIGSPALLISSTLRKDFFVFRASNAEVITCFTAP